MFVWILVDIWVFCRENRGMSTLEEAERQVKPENEFAGELLNVMVPLRSALMRMLGEWGAPKSFSVLQRESGAGRTICWQVFRIASAENLVAEARHAPTPSSLKRLLGAASVAGVSEATVRKVVEAAEAFHAFSKRNADDRTAFDSMLVGAASDGANDTILLSQRRAAYRSMSHIWGVQTDLHYYGSILRRSAHGAQFVGDQFGGDGFDRMEFNVQRGIRRLRPDAEVLLFGYQPNPNKVPGVQQVEGAIDAQAALIYGMPVLPQFSTSPLPEIQKFNVGADTIRYKTVSREIGPRGNLDYALGRFNREQPYMVDVDGRRLFHMTFAYRLKPVAMAIHELIVHRPSFPEIRPEMMVFQYEKQPISQEEVRQSVQFPVEEKLKYAGRADAAELVEVPQYAELLRYGADHVGWDLSEFDVYRVRMPYPIMFSAVRIFFYVD
jgi:hypothetical protein